MIRFRVGDARTVIEGVEKSLLRDLDEITSYKIDGAHFSPSFRQRRWDGKTHLLRYSRRFGLRLYTGLVPIAARYLRNLGHRVEVIDERRPLNRTVDTPLPWLDDEFVLRPYQEDSVEAILSKNPDLPGRGMVSSAVRSGKTVMAGGLIHRTQARALFLVHQERQFDQTWRLYSHLFGRDRVGMVGSGYWEPNDVTVGMVQALHPKRKTAEVKRLLQSVDVLVVDECHHLKQAQTWKDLVLKCDARIKVGISATIYLSRKKESEKATVWLQALTGPLLYTISTKRLIKMGVLVPATIRLVKVQGPDVVDVDWDQAQKKGIVQHDQRNRIIARIAQRRVRKGRKVLVIARRREHIDRLISEFQEHDLGDLVVRIDGRTPKGTRTKRVSQFVDGSKPLLIGSVFQEAVDIPQIEDVIVADGGKDRKATIQKLRNLTPHKGKTDRVYVYDMIDLHNPTLAAHSRARISAYRSEDCFDFEVIDWSKRKTRKKGRR